MLTTDQKGAIAELAIARHAAELGIGVWSAYTVEPYDLILDLRPALLRVQCKWASRQGDIAVVRCCRHRRNGAGLLRRLYAADEIDAFAAYCAVMDKCYLAAHGPVCGADCDSAEARTDEEQPSHGHQLGRGLRVRRYTVPSPGAIAQLGERRRGTPKVAGSSPAGSTDRGRFTAATWTSLPARRLRVVPRAASEPESRSDARAPG
jgi:hypothetical protein